MNERAAPRPDVYMSPLGGHMTMHAALYRHRFTLVCMLHQQDFYLEETKTAANKCACSVYVLILYHDDQAMKVVSI